MANNGIRFCFVAKISLLSIFVWAILGVPYTNCLDLVGKSAESMIEKRDDGHLHGRVFNFANIVPDIQLKLGDKRINVDNLVLNEQEEEKITPLLHGLTLEDRVTDWGLLAMIEKLLNSSPIGTYDIEDLDASGDDLIMTVEQLQPIYNGLLNNQADLPEPLSPEGGEIMTRQKRKVVAYAPSKWPTTIPWRFRSSFSSTFRANIRAGLELWETPTCLKFVEKTDRRVEPHIAFYMPTQARCNSYIGKQQMNGQDISLSNSCNNPGSVAHEVGHALGLLHEQSRPDRDQYITIQSANIQAGREMNFIQIDWVSTFSAGIPYDFSSLMHYRALAFSKNRANTITPLWNFYEATMGAQPGPSFYDVKAINFHYCSEMCNGSSLEWPQCENDGYRDPNDCSKCICQKGWAPPFCNTILPHTRTGQCGGQLYTATTSVQTISLTATNRFPFRYAADMECVWKIKSPPATRVLLSISRIDLPCISNACRDYIEVRFADMSRIGPRFCCRTRPTSSFPSYGRELLLFFHSAPVASMAVSRGFLAAFRYDTCGGCHPVLSPSRESACLSLQREECDPHSDRWICGYSICQLYRNNTCYKQLRYCCQGYDRSGNQCVRNRRTPRVTTTPLPPGIRNCRRPRADIVFLLDVSNNLDATEFRRAKLFIEDIISTLQIGTTAFQVGIVTFSDTPQLVLHLDENGDLAAIIKLVNQIPWRGGSAHTSEALKMVRQQSFSMTNGDRGFAPNILIVLTSGQSAAGYEPRDEATNLHQAGVSVIALGTGVTANITEIEGIVSDSAYLYEDANYHALQGVKNTISLLACGPVSAAVVPTTRTSSTIRRTPRATTTIATTTPTTTTTTTSIPEVATTTPTTTTTTTSIPEVATTTPTTTTTTTSIPAVATTTPTTTTTTTPIPAVNGGWSLWDPWSTCSVTCGGGTMNRSRYCTNPPPSGTGAPCEGRSTRSRVCFFPACE